jgi:hypothetical protein
MSVRWIRKSDKKGSEVEITPQEILVGKEERDKFNQREICNEESVLKVL